MEVFSYYFWTFMLGSFMGVVIETIWCFLRYHKIESRKGLIYGPFNPLYGFAAMILSLSINNIHHPTNGNVFLTGVIVASVIEYLCSYFQEKLTGTVSWDYKSFKFNLNGRINLAYSVMWGILTIWWYNSAMPVIDNNINLFNNYPAFTIIMFMFIVVDCLISLYAAVRRKQRKENIYKNTKLEKHFDYVYNDELMNKIYPNSEFVDD